MSDSFRCLQAAVNEFAHRPRTDQVSVDQLRDVIEALEGELDLLYEPDPATARAEAEADAKRFVERLRIDAKALPGRSR
jgi:phage-related baseplate assembly protein